jgi:hypothetical protein
MLQVSPVATERKATDRADVVVDAELGAGEPFQKNAEPSGRDVEAARLNPDTARVGNPGAVVIQVGVCEEVLAAAALGSRPSVRLLNA